MQHITTEYAQSTAQRKLDEHVGSFRITEWPLETLTGIPWSEFTRGRHSQEELITLNLALDPRGCLGRAALCIALLERFFGEKHAEYLEVTDDWFHGVLMKQWKKSYDGIVIPPETWLDELLMYEEPHGVVTRDGKQFDPLASQFPDIDVSHPGFFRFPAWSAIASAMTVSQAFLASDPDLRLDVLARAEKLCPETCLVAQARIQPLVELDRMEEARAALLHLVRVRPTARTFFVLEEVFDHKHPKCISMYGEVLWDLLKQRIVQEVVVP